MRLRLVFFLLLSCVSVCPGWRQLGCFPSGSSSISSCLLLLSLVVLLPLQCGAFFDLCVCASGLRADTYPSRQWRLLANVQTAVDASSELFSVKPECSALGSCWAK